MKIESESRQVKEPKLSDNSRKLKPKKQKRAMNGKGKKVSGRMVETGSQKSSEG